MTGVYEQLKRDLDYLGWARAAECFASLAEKASEAGFVQNIIMPFNEGLCETHRPKK
jgi:hypothetical protein